MQISTIGLDLAKHVFQVHGIDADEKIVVRKQLRRSQVVAFFEKVPPCLVGIEACASAHHWARELEKLGHTVRLMPASDVKAYVKRNKNDAADAAAICEAVRRPTVRSDGAQIPDRLAAGHRGEDPSATSKADAAQDTGASDPTAYPAHQCTAIAYGRTRIGCSARTRRTQRTLGDREG